MKRLALACIAACALLAGPVASAADYSVTVYAGWRASSGIDNATTGEEADIDDSASFSIAVDRAYDAGRTLQLFYSQQSTRLATGSAAQPSFDLKIRHLHFGGTAEFGGPYAVGGLGVAWLSPGLDGLDSEVRPSMNVGFGYAWPLGTNVAVRLEGRVYLTLLNSSSGLFCSGGCIVVLKGDGLLQGEAMLGLSARF
jgi:hypothetical protein